MHFCIFCISTESSCWLFFFPPSCQWLLHTWEKLVVFTGVTSKIILDLEVEAKSVLCPAVWFSPWPAYTFHARLCDIALLSKAASAHHQISLQPKPQGGESELTLTTRGSLHAVFAQMCMIAQLFGSKKGRVSKKEWSIGGLLLKCPYVVALECLCLSVSSTFLLSCLLIS